MILFKVNSEGHRSRTIMVHIVKGFHALQSFVPILNTHAIVFSAPAL